MAHLIDLKTSTDTRGSLTVIEKVLPFDIKRVFYIYGVGDPSLIRGGHRHNRTIQALISVAGKCSVFTNNGSIKEKFELDSPQKCLILEPQDWHTMSGFSKDSVLLVLASEYYDRSDYISEEYK